MDCCCVSATVLQSFLYLCEKVTSDGNKLKPIPVCFENHYLKSMKRAEAKWEQHGDRAQHVA